MKSSLLITATFCLLLGIRLNEGKSRKKEEITEHGVRGS